MQAVFITREARIPKAYFDKLKNLGVTVYEKRSGAEETARQIADAEIVAAFYNDDLEKVLYDAPKLKYFINTSVGYERIDLERLRRKGVTFSNCPTYNSQAVAEHAIGLMFAAARKITQANQSLKNGDWLDEQFEGTEIHGKKIGIVGHGHVGSRIASGLRGLEVEVGFTDSKSTAGETDSLISWADVIFVCAPLNAQTKNMIDARRLALLRPGAIIINVSRGAIINEEALYELLKRGDVAAGLDVFESEPTGNKADGIIMRLAGLPNVVATPHTAYNTKESGENLGREILANVEACLKGRPINVIGATE